VQSSVFQGIEAMRRPTMRFVMVKTVEQQSHPLHGNAHYSATDRILIQQIAKL
jgi:hypothetical protein